MILQRFVRWCETATSGQRADGYAILARSLRDGRLDATERDAALAALSFAADDPSPAVRLAVAAELGADPNCPRALAKSLLLDVDHIAVRVAGSPVLTDDDLLDALPIVRDPVRVGIAARPHVSAALSVALARCGGPDACIALADNPGATLPALAFRCMIERHAGDPALRSRLAERRDVPADVLQTLVLEAGHALQNMPLVSRVLGEERAGRVAFDACTRATAALADRVEGEAVAVLVEHLRITGQLTPAFLVRIACAGNIDLLAAALAMLSGHAARRVRSVVVDGRRASFLALAAECGLGAATATLLYLVVREWKAVALAAPAAREEDLPELVVRRVAAAYRQVRGRGLDQTSALLRQLEGETLRAAARTRLELLLAA